MTVPNDTSSLVIRLREFDCRTGDVDARRRPRVAERKIAALA
jgi:hypothetical protein